MALTSAALTTVAKINAELGISGEDSYVEQLIEAISARVARYCNRTFHYAEDIEENVRGYGYTDLIVSRAPLLSIDSITIEGASVQSADYKIKDAQAGVIYSEVGWSWTALGIGGTVTQDKSPTTEDPKYVVTYTGGYITPQQDADGVGTRSLPYDLEDAVIEWITARYRRKGADARIRSEKLLSWSIGYSDAAQSGLAMPMSVQSVLDLYKFFAHGD